MSVVHTPAEIVASLARQWARNPKPVWLVIGSHSGRVLTWALPKHGAKRAAAKMFEPCFLAKAEKPKLGGDNAGI